MDAMLDGARSELDPAKRESMYHKIVDTTLEECPIIYHATRTTSRSTTQAGGLRTGAAGIHRETRHGFVVLTLRKG